MSRERNGLDNHSLHVVFYLVLNDSRKVIIHLFKKAWMFTQSSVSQRFTSFLMINIKHRVVSDLSTCFWGTQRVNSHKGSDLVSPKSVSLVHPFYGQIQPLTLSSCGNANCPDGEKEWHENNDLEICLYPSSILGQCQIYNNHGRMTGPKGGCSERVILLLHCKNWSLFSSLGIAFIAME
jgi:hypothetical protein